MKVAISADLHLTTREDHPERFKALEDIFRQCGELKVDLFIIAGDLFDKDRQNFADFETSIKRHAPKDLDIVIIPGNHDPEITSASFAVKNLTVYAEPELREFDGTNLKFLFLPYAAERGMGEELASFKDGLAAGSWVLIGHGDWSAGMIARDPYEKGVYMPLTRGDITMYQPAEVFLGHIHLPYDDGPIHYPGSPCPMDITETGPRRFLVFDTETQQVEPFVVKSDVIYFDERFVLLPVEDEETFLKNLVKDRIAGWALPEDLKDRAVIRAKFSGYVADRSRSGKAAEEAFADFQFYEDAGPDLSDLNLATDSDRIHIARQVDEWLKALEWPDLPQEPSKDEMLAEALKVIYGA
jgi:exonuclease SbcD